MADPIQVKEFDPLGRSHGKNTRLFLVYIASGVTPTEYQIQHELDFVPSWVRVTPCAYNSGRENGGVLGTQFSAFCQPVIDEALTTVEPRWDEGPVATPFNLTQELNFLMANPAFNGGNDAWFIVEIGRTHSVPK